MINKNMKFIRTIVIICTCSLFFFSSIHAQKYKGQRFKVGALVGVNGAQIDGDRIFGYNKTGIQAGIQGIAMLNKKQYLSLEFLMSQRGAVSTSADLKRIADINIRSNYVEVPILFNTKLPLGNSEYGAYLYSGFSIGRLLGAKIGGVNHPRNANPILQLSDRTTEFDIFEIDYIIGGNYFFNKNWGITLRHTVALTTFFEPSEVDINMELKSLRNLFFTIGGIYVLN